MNVPIIRLRPDDPLITRYPGRSFGILDDPRYPYLKASVPMTTGVLDDQGGIPILTISA